MFERAILHSYGPCDAAGVQRHQVSVSLFLAFTVLLFLAFTMYFATYMYMYIEMKI